MKIAILTLTASDNCGSLLQAFALQYYLQQKMKIEDVDLIDFRCKQSQQTYSILPKKFFLHPKDTFFRLLHIFQLLSQKRDYDVFRKKYLNLTPITFKNEQELANADINYRYVVCGSDQIWNVKMFDFDHAYLLEWVKHAEKIAYAASLGGSKLVDGYSSDYLKKVFSSYKAISTREETGKNQISDICDVNVDITVDPTLLLSKEEWSNTISKPMINREYIFYYSYAYRDDGLNRIVEEYARRKELPVYVINVSKWLRKSPSKYGFKLFHKTGPEAFLNLMKYAKVAFVQSFHGVIFANMLNTNFYFLDNNDEEHIDKRLGTILTLFNEKNRIVRSINDINDDTIDFNHHNKRLEEIIEQSKLFLSLNVNNEKKDI